MADQIISTLSSKRREIESHITKLQADLEQARRDLSAILAATAVFSGEGPLSKSYMNLAKLFPRHELPKLCRDALEASTAPISTREIASYVIQSKGLDGKDRHLRKAIAYKVVNVIRRWERERKVSRTGKKAGAVVWREALACRHGFKLTATALFDSVSASQLRRPPRTNSLE